MCLATYVKKVLIQNSSSYFSQSKITLMRIKTTSLDSEFVALFIVDVYIFRRELSESMSAFRLKASQ